MDPIQAEPQSLEELQRVLSAKWMAGEINASQVRSRVKKFIEDKKAEESVLISLASLFR